MGSSRERQQGSSGEGRRRGIALLVAAVIVICLSTTASAGLRALASPTVHMSAAANPSTVAAGDIFEYTIDITNTGDQSPTNFEVVVTLPSGFTYAGPTWLAFNGIDSWWHDQHPYVAGRVLTWNTAAVPDFTAPPKRMGNYYGIHTFVQDHFYDPHIDIQLDKARELGDVGAYVTQLLYSVTPATARARDEWKTFVQRACSKQLTPIVRLATGYTGAYWEKPTLDGGLAQAFGRVVADLRTVLPSGCLLYVQILNETNLTIEWSGQWPDPVAYGQFVVQAANAIRSHTAFDGRIRILAGALAPGGNYNNIAYTWEMLGVPGALWAWDAWATHPYPGNHPPQYNIHDGSAYYPELVVDSYILEMQQISRRGRHVYDVLATETGYRLTDSTYQFEGYPPITDDLRAGYIRDAFQNTWTNWPEFRAATPYELNDPARTWWQFDWLRTPSYDPYPQFTAVKNIPFKPGFLPNGRLTITFRARAGYTAGAQTMSVMATASNAAIAPASAIVHVLPGSTPTNTRTRTPSHTASASAASTATLPPSATATATLTRLPGEPTDTPTATPTLPAPTATPTVTATPSPTATPTITASPSATSAPSATPTQTPALCTPSIIASFSVGAEPKGLAVDPQTQRLHVGMFASSRLHIYSTQSYAFIAQVDTQGLHANGVAADADTGMVYVSNRDSANVSVVNGRTAAYVTRIGVGALPFGVAAGQGRLYVGNYGLSAEDASVSVIDTTNNALLTTKRVGPRPAMAATDSSGNGYVVTTGADTLPGALYSVSRSGELGSVPTDFSAFGAAYLDGRVYVSHRGASGVGGARVLAVIDSLTNRLIESIDLPGPAYAVAANPTTRRIYAVDAANNRVYVLDTTSHALIATLSVGAQNADEGGQGIAVDPVLNRIFVANWQDGTVSVIADCQQHAPLPTPSRTVTPTATRTATVSPLPTQTVTSAPSPTSSRTATTTANPSRTATATPTQSISITQTPTATGTATQPATATGTRSPSATATATQPATATRTASATATATAQCTPAVVATIAAGVHPKSLAIDGPGRRLHVALFDAAVITSFDADTLASVGTVDIGAHGSRQPNAITVDQATGQLYVTSRSDNNLALIDGRSGLWTGSIVVGASPWGVAVDGLRAYVSNFSDNTVTVIDTALGNVISTLPVASQPALAAAGAGKGYVASFAAGSASIVTDTAVQQVSTAAEALGIAYLDGKLYVGSRSGKRLTVIDVASAQVIMTVTLPGPAFAVAANPVSGRVFVVDAANDRLYALDATTGALAATLPTGRQNINDGGQGLAVDSVRGQVYVANYVDGTITVVDDCVRQAPSPTPTRPTYTPTSRFLFPTILVAYDASLSFLSQAAVAPRPSSASCLAVDGASGLTYLRQDGGAIVAVDGALRRIDRLDAPRLVGPCALLAQGGYLFASDAEAGLVHALQTSPPRRLFSVADLARPAGLAFDAQAGLLYVAEAGAETVAIIDATSGAVVGKLKMGRSPHILALDPQGRLLYAATPGDKSVWVWPLSAQEPSQRLAIPGLGVTLGLTVDEMGSAYLVYAVSPKTRAIAQLVWDDSASAWRLRAIVEGDYRLRLIDATALAVHQGIVYTLSDGYALAFDGATGKESARTPLHVAAGSFGLAFDAASGRILTVDILSERLEAVDAPGRRSGER